MSDNQIKTGNLNTLEELITSLNSLKTQLEKNEKPSKIRIDLIESRLKGMLELIKQIATKD